MLNSPKKIYLDGTVVHKKKTKAGISPGNNGIDLGNWIEKSIQAGSINVGSSVNSLDDLTDVTVGSPANGDVLTYNSILQKFVNGPAPASVTQLDDLSDVGLINTLASGDILSYDITSQKFINLPADTYVTGNITQGVLSLPTGDRTISMGANQLTFTGSKYQKFYVSTQTDLYTEVIADTLGSRLVYYDDTGTNHITNISFASIAGAGSLTNEGKVYVDIVGTVVISSNSKVYKLGESSAFAPDYYDALANAPQTLVLNAANNKIFRVDTAFQFLTSSQISPSNLFHPTKAEVETFLFSLGASTQSGNLNRYFYYNATTDPAIPYTYVYYLTGDNKLIEVYKPEEHWFSTSIGVANQVFTDADNGAISPIAQVGDLFNYHRTVDKFTVSWNGTSSTGGGTIKILDNFGNVLQQTSTLFDTSNNPYQALNISSSFTIGNSTVTDIRKQGYAVQIDNLTPGDSIVAPRMSFRVRKNK